MSSKEPTVYIESLVEPHPSNRRGVPLIKAYPEVAAQWCYRKNCGFGPEDFSYGSKVKVWWQCEFRHVYDMRILDRTLRQENCPYCSNKRVSPETSLGRLFPAIAKEWHKSKNGNKTPADFTAHSSKSAVWQCRKNLKHVWTALIKSRTVGSGCPHCHDERLLDLSNYPKQLKLFDKKKNPGVDPKKLTTTQAIWWRCGKGPDHSWCKPFRKQAEVLVCPFCTNRMVSITNSLSKLYPQLAKELHPTKNGSLKASDIPAGKTILVWWKCQQNSRHIWRASVHNRTGNSSGCPECWKLNRPGYFKQLAAESKRNLN
jgi:hypothetical protein